jgi:chromosome segregation ATPase
MNHQSNRRALLSFSIAFLVTFTVIPHAVSELVAPVNAKALLDEAKQNQAEQKRAAMQKELDRLDADLKQGQTELGELEQTISKVGDAVNESKNNTELLAGRRKNVTQDLELLALRSEAENVKTEGLNLLNTAHAKAKEALTKRNEELDIKRAIVSAEFSKTEKTRTNREGERNGSSRTLSELRRNLEKAESKSALANSRAREAMDAASKKLKQAEDAAAKVEKKQAEFASEKLPPATR